MNGVHNSQNMYIAAFMCGDLQNSAHGQTKLFDHNPQTGHQQKLMRNTSLCLCRILNDNLLVLRELFILRV